MDPTAVITNFSQKRSAMLPPNGLDLQQLVTPDISTVLDKTLAEILGLAPRIL